MANLGDLRRSANRIAEKFVPTSDWTQDAKGNYLFVDLPGFKKEELRLELTSTGHINISGERAVDENKSIYFVETLALPENSDTDNISGNFDGDFLHVTVPRRPVVEENKQEDDEITRNENGNPTAEKTSVQEEPNNNEEKGDVSKETSYLRVASLPLEMAMKFLKKNKGAVLSVAIAFSIGMLVCRTFESSAAE
ncbi:18.2 kDa class I heat shock protein-like [Herrania umbratica]|uniref:18.2 kDa class I heat shock protein-like n=1 Tax=Herrania umbratica TaxID=108875 RepID=A0A6J1AFI3_9ROSI|nr:18.2 kDa class I heat shock protein-like [Herrania umbratica]